MKKRISLLVSTLALVALASLANAAPGVKFAVQGPDGAVTPTDKFTVTDAGVVNATKIGVNTANPSAYAEVVAPWTVSAGTNLTASFTSYADTARLTVRHAQGTPTTPLNTKSGNQIGNINFRGHDGTNFSSVGIAAITVNAEENFTATAQGTRISFLTTPIGAAVPAERFRVANDGRLRLSNQPAAPAQGSACTAGDLILNAASATLYLCSATNTWTKTTFAAY